MAGVGAWARSRVFERWATCGRPCVAILPAGIGGAGCAAAASRKAGALPGHATAGGSRPGALPDALQGPAAAFRRWPRSLDGSGWNSRSVCGGVVLAADPMPGFLVIDHHAWVFHAPREKPRHKKKKSTA